MPEKREIRLAFDPSDLQIAEEAARSSEVDFQSLPQSQFIDGFSAVLIAGGALLIAKFVLDLIERFRGGIVIDLRSNGKGSIKRDKAVPAGWAVVLTEDGQVEISVHDASKDASERLLETIIGGTLKSAADIAKEATKQLGAGHVK